VRHLTNVVGFDDAPFAHEHRGDVRLFGVVCARTRLDGVISGRVRRDGANATRAMIAMVRASQFARHVRAVLLQGIAVAGFNVVDVHALADALGVPVLVVMRRRPDLPAIEEAIRKVPGGARKWALVQAAGAPEPLGKVLVQRVGLTREEALELLRATTLHGHLPEPLRLAHLIAGGVTTGKSRGRA
jgi:hypothetical protein